jgi:actin-related protein
MYNELRVAPEEHNTLITESCLNPRANSEKLAQTMFEYFNTPALYIGMQQVLSLYGCGLTSGIALDIGYSSSRAVCVSEGKAIYQGIDTVARGGKIVSDMINDSLSRQNVSVAISSVVENVKCQHCFVQSKDRSNVTRSDTRNENVTYELPDGSTITLGDEMFVAPEEALFGSVETRGCGIHTLVYECINRCRPAIQNTLWKHVVLSGGTSMFPGLVDRLSSELKSTQTQFEVEINASANRKYSAWVGGSVLASLSSFSNQWMTIEEYNEFGPSAAVDKFNVTVGRAEANQLLK